MSGDVTLTLKLRSVPLVREDTLKAVIYDHLGHLRLRIDRMLMTSDGALVTFTVHGHYLDMIDRSFPIKDERCVIHYISMWDHDHDHQSLVVLRNPPQGVSKETVEVYLEGQEINAKVVNISDDDNAITLELNNPIDLPYLVTKPHKMKRVPVTFEEVSVCDNEVVAADEYDEDIGKYQEVGGNQNNEEHYYEASEYFQSSSRALKISQIQIGGKIAEYKIRTTLKENYHLEVDHFSIVEDSAYITFTSNTGVDTVLNNPINMLLGYPVQCSSINKEDIPLPRPKIPPRTRKVPPSSSPQAPLSRPSQVPPRSSHVPPKSSHVPPRSSRVPPRSSHVPPSSPQVLLLENLPELGENIIKPNLELLFNNAGCMVDDCTLQGDNNTAIIKFRDQTSLTHVLNHPPDNSTFLGQQLIYTALNEREVFPEHSEPATFTLIAEDLPDCHNVDEIFSLYLKNTTQVQPVTCEVRDQKAIIKCSSREDMQRIMENQPKSTFFGKRIKFKTEPVQSTPSPPKRTRSFPTTSTNYNGNQSSDMPPVIPEAATPPPIKPRTNRSGTFTDSIIIKRLPSGAQDYLKLYLNNRLGLYCQTIQVNGDVAVVKLSHNIDVKELQNKALHSPYPNGNVVLLIEPFKPSSSIIVTSSNIPDYGVKLFCENYGTITEFIERKTGEYIVKYQDKQSHDRILSQSVHRVGPNHLNVADFIPELEEATPHRDRSPSPPPPLPERISERKVAYSWTSIREQIPYNSLRYYLHIQREINEETLAVNGEYRVNQQMIEVKPLAGSEEISDWDVQIRGIIRKYKAKFASAELKVESHSMTAIVNYLGTAEREHSDFHYQIDNGIANVAGHEDTVNDVCKTITNMLAEEIEMTLTLEKPQQYIEYLLKFAINEIEAIQPPVKVTAIPDKPNCVEVRGVQKSLDAVKSIAERKIAESHQEVIRLNSSAYRLLNSIRGKRKIREELAFELDSIVYVFDKGDGQSEFSNQVYILSPHQNACFTARRSISSLVSEKKLTLTPERSAILGTQDWRQLVEDYTSKYFLHIASRGEDILLTGEEKYLSIAAEQILTYIDVQHRITVELPILAAEWQIISMNRQQKLKAIQNEAKKYKVKLELPDKTEDSGSLLISINGDIKHVDNIKGQLQMLTNEVITKEFQIPPQVGLSQITDKVANKCRELEREHKVIITHEVVKKAATNSSVGTAGRADNIPQRVISATSSSGLRVRVFTGDPSKMKCDALAIFISQNPNTDYHPIMASLTTTGGSDVQKYYDVSLKSKSNLIAATICRSRDVTNLKCSEIFYCILPLNNVRMVNATLGELFSTAISSHDDIVITPFTSRPHNYPVDVYAESVLSALLSQGMYDTTFNIFIEKEHHKEIFLKKMRQLNYTIHGNPTQQAGVGGTGNGLILHVLSGSITETVTDVVVNNTSIDMKPGSNAICTAIHNAAGKSLGKSCQALKDKNEMLKNGKVHMVDSGDLMGKIKCKKVVLVHVPGKLKNVPPTQDQIDYIKDVIKAALKKADNEQLKSLSMPAFCLGVGNYTVAESAKPTLDAIREFSMKSVHLKEVYIIIYDKKLYEQYAKFYDKYAVDLGYTVDRSTLGREGVCSVMRNPRSRADTVTSINLLSVQPDQPDCHMTFQVYGVDDGTLRNVDRKINTFIKNTIVDNMVDLGEVINVLNDKDMHDIQRIAREHKVAMKVQQSLSRVLITGEERSVERAHYELQFMVKEIFLLLNESHMYEWTSRHDDGHIEPYPPVVSQKLEVAYKRRQNNAKFTLDNVEYAVDLIKMEEKELTRGLIRSVSRTQKLKTEYPTDWDIVNMNTSKVVEFFNVAEGSYEYRKATERFLQTAVNNKCTIVSVKRVQNPSEYTRYQSLKTTWRGLNLQEKELFHGSKIDSIEPICTHGFNRGYAAEANAAHYGKGVYFALNSDYSINNKYSAPDTDKNKHILVCSLLVCNMAKGHSSIKVPPPLPNRPDVLYDTLVDNVDKPTIFVAMKDSQAYPKYWITFKI